MKGREKVRFLFIYQRYVNFCSAIICGLFWLCSLTFVELKILMMQSEPDILPTTPSPLFGLTPPALPNPSHCSIPASPHPVGVRQLFEGPAAVQPDPLTGLWNGSL